MKIKLNAIFVDDQDKALKFYTEVLGFEKKNDFQVAGPFRWLTVVSPEEPDAAELVLEPNANPISKTYQEGLLKQGIPITAFEVADIEGEHRRLKQQGVVFTRDPVQMGPVKIAIFADTCGNLLQIYQHAG
ncbi:VOC family protein [Terricaulis sp.]|uniref:VOC family protein n=1 Tax=Terricaulis sp. TaxID=2768686 RepID=UPI003783EBB5